MLLFFLFTTVHKSSGKTPMTGARSSVSLLKHKTRITISAWLHDSGTYNPPNISRIDQVSGKFFYSTPFNVAVSARRTIYQTRSTTIIKLPVLVILPEKVTVYMGISQLMTQPILFTSCCLVATKWWLMAHNIQHKYTVSKYVPLFIL